MADNLRGPKHPTIAMVVPTIVKLTAAWLAATVAIPIGLAVALLGVLVLDDVSRGSYPPLIGAISGPTERSLLGERFRERVSQNFPVGSSEAALIAELRGQGFKLELPSGSRETGTATYRHGTLVIICDDFWTVRWQSNERGNIQEVRGEFTPQCL